jgi:ferric-dicitrate binding protein FerR (iron transport regulator)
MGKNSDESRGKARRLQAAGWWVELDCGHSFTRARRKAWLKWFSQPKNQRAYQEIAQVRMWLRDIERPPEARTEELQA